MPGPSTVRDVTLTAGGLPDLLAPWIDQFNTASQNATTLLDNFAFAPGVGLQQLIANLSDFTQQVLNDPSSLSGVATQMQDNLDAVLTGLPLQNATSDTTNIVIQHTLDGGSGIFPVGHSGIFGAISGYLPADQAATLTPIINFLASPESGIIMGFLGPLISPWVALFNSIGDGDNVNEILANTVGAFFNGADINLDSLLPAINGAGYFPAGISLGELDFAFGGLLSTGSVKAGPYELFDSSGNVVATIPAVGGSIFNNAGLDLIGVPVVGAINAPSQPIGPLGALEGMAQTIAALLGWDGSASPLAGVDLPVIPADVSDAGGAAAAATDLSSLLQEFLAPF